MAWQVVVEGVSAEADAVDLAGSALIGRDFPE
jgi:hypothetical protein